MKQRRTKILALFLAAAMAVGSPATAFSVSAEDWVSADEMEGFGSDGEISPEDFGDAAEDDFFGSEEELVNEVTEEIAGETVGTETTETGIGEKTEYADGTYVPDNFSFSGGTGKTRITCPSIVIENGVVYGNILFSSKKYTKINLNDKDYPVLSNENGSLFKIPVILNQDMVIKATTVAMTEAHDIDYTIKITQDTSKFTPKPEEKADYTAVDAALAMIPADLSVYTDETVAAVNSAKNAIVRDYGKDKQAEVDKMAADLKAAVEALVLKGTITETTELSVKNTTGMFKVKKAVLQKSDSGQKLLLTLNSTGYEYMFKGTYEEAVENGNNRDNWVKYENTDAGYQFEIPVSDGEAKLCLVSVSKNKLAAYENGTAALQKAFYPRQVVIDYDAKTLVSGDFDHTVSLTVTNNVNRFNVEAASLHTVGGPNSNGYKETLELTMGSNSFDKIYVGNADAAGEAESTIAITDRKASVLVRENAVGGATALDYLEKPVVLSFHSVKKDQWYERVFTVSKKSGTVKIVEHVAATEVKLDVDEKELVEGQSSNLVATVSPENTSDMVVWSSSDEKVATVDQNGNVKAVGEGTAVITVTVGGLSAACNVTVVKKTFTYTVQALLAKGTAQSKNITGVIATATDEAGNVIEAKPDSKTMLEFENLDAAQTYTVKVVRDGYYTVNAERNGNQYTFTPTGKWEYTGTISRKDNGATVNVTFRKDNLKAALKEIPSDTSLYTEESVAALKKAVAVADPDGMDFVKRDEQADVIKAALNNLKLVQDGEYLSEAVVTNQGMSILDLKIIVENGVAKAQFIGSHKAYGKIFLGTSSAARKATDADPNMILPDNDGKLVVSSTGVEAYQFTMPISGFANEITFSSYATARKKWTQQTITFSSGKLQKYIKTTGVKLNQTECMMNVGTNVTLAATVEPENATYRDVVWKSDNEKIATVDQKGNVNAVGEGTAVITAQVGEFAAECKVAVHTFETISAVGATCTKTGFTEGVKCSVCGTTLKAQEEVPMLKHKEEVIAGKAATCTRAGLTEGVKCSVCGTILKAQEKIPALGHKAENLPAIAATCTKDGWSAGKKCSVCGMILSARKLVKATGHKEEVIPAVEATPGHTGLTEGKKCSVCGEILEAQKETPALPEIPSQVLISKVALTAKGSVKVAAGKKIQLTAKITPGNADNKEVTWTSSNKKVATVNSKGVVTMKKKAGGKSVVITATAKDGSNVYGSIKLTCMKGAVKKITISGNKSVKAGKTLKLKAKVTASSNANKKVAWSSSNKKLATVNSKGVVKTFKGKKGTVKITVRSLDGTNKKKTVTIKIK